MHAAHGLTSLLLIPPEFVLLHGAYASRIKGHEHTSVPRCKIENLSDKSRLLVPGRVYTEMGMFLFHQENGAEVECCYLAGCNADEHEVNKKNTKGSWKAKLLCLCWCLQNNTLCDRIFALANINQSMYVYRVDMWSFSPNLRVMGLRGYIYREARIDAHSVKPFLLISLVYTTFCFAWLYVKLSMGV